MINADKMERWVKVFGLLSGGSWVEAFSDNDDVFLRQNGVQVGGCGGGAPTKESSTVPSM